MDVNSLLDQTGAVPAMAHELGLDEATARHAAQTMLPALVEGLQAHGAAQGFGGIGGMIEAMGGGNLLDLVLAREPTPTQPGSDLLGTILGGAATHAIVEQAAARTGLSPDLLRRMLPILAMLVGGYLARRAGHAAPAQPQPTPSQPVPAPVAQSGGALGAILGQVLGAAFGGAPAPAATPAPAAPSTPAPAPAGQGGLGGVIGMLDRDGDGNILDDLGDLAGGLNRRP